MPDADPDARPSLVPPVALDALRVRGEPKILPSDEVKAAVRRSARRELLVPLKVCLDRRGRPESVRLLHSSGHLGYDVDLVNGVAAWRYRPFVVDGKVVPVCSVVSFSYRQR